MLAALTVISGNEGLICGPSVVDEQLWVRHQVRPQPPQEPRQPLRSLLNRQLCTVRIALVYLVTH